MIHRPGKLGLGTATIAAMRFAIEHGFDYLLNMDADFSHDPEYIPALRAGMADHDVMIGSRYVPGGGVEGGFTFKRRFMSTAIAYNTRRASRMMRSNSAIRMRGRAARRGSPGAGLRASSVRGAQPQSIARSATVNCCNAGAAAIRHR